MQFSFSAAKTGEVSVNPYPWIVNIPKSLKAFATFGSNPEAPLRNFTLTDASFPNVVISDGQIILNDN